MKVAFRADASLQIGTGHIMRCLTLADTLSTQGVECHFFCRETPGNLIAFIRSKGYQVHALIYEPLPKVDVQCAERQLTHSAWLDSTQEEDAAECVKIMSDFQFDRLVVDHYALDRHWESALQACCDKLMVIDDLADRVHVCDFLLDQNLGRKAQDYASLVPQSCQLFIGPNFALLRADFSALRDYSLERRVNPQLKHLLITMGGVDQPNATGQVLTALKSCPLAADCRITVVMGAAAPWLAQIQEQAAVMPWSTEVLVNIPDMAQRMADSDLAFGAAGSTSWERCCLGLPTMMAILAENQIPIGNALNRSGAAALIGCPEDEYFQSECVDQVSQYVRELTLLKEMSQAAAKVTTGAGSQLITQRLLEK